MRKNCSKTKRFEFGTGFATITAGWDLYKVNSMFKKLLFVGAVVMAANNAQSATLNSAVEIAEENAGVFGISSSGDTFTVSWDTENAEATTPPTDPGAAWFKFNVGSSFTLSLDEYDAEPASVTSTFQLRNSAGVTQTVLPSVLPDAPNTPGGATNLNAYTNTLGGAIPGPDGTANLFGPGDQFADLFGVLAAGDYFIGVLEGAGGPASASVQFSVSAVPIPAAGILFGSALLGAAVLRRRSIQNKLGMPTV